MDNTITINGVQLWLSQGRYTNGSGLALFLIDADGDTWYTVTINVPGEMLAADEVIVKTYSENALILPPMVAAGWLAPLERTVRVGYAIAPVCKVLVPIQVP
jgi:hypothetical protein